jgi:hypothetical protein
MSDERNNRPIVIGQLGFRVLAGVAKSIRDRKGGVHIPTPSGVEELAEQPPELPAGEDVAGSSEAQRRR